MSYVPDEQQADGSSYATPLEYIVTPEDSNCDFDELIERFPTTNAYQFLRRVMNKYAPLSTIISFTPATLPTGLPPDAEYLTGAFFGNSPEMTDASARFSRGLNVTYTEAVKRLYYTAALVLSNLESDSFTELFKAAVITLANSISSLPPGPGSLNATDALATAFIFEWGNFLIDQVSSSIGLTVDPCAITSSHSVPIPPLSCCAGQDGRRPVSYHAHPGQCRQAHHPEGQEGCPVRR